MESKRAPAKALLHSIRFAYDRLLQACLSGDTTLQVGLTGAAVAKVQQALMDLGYCLREFGPDGVFGHETQDAVAAFNAAIAVTEDRAVGSRTMAALDDCFADERPDRPEDRSGWPAHSPPQLPTPKSPEAATATLEYARRAVGLALAQAAAGAHFLAGAAGATPGGTEGTRIQPGSVTITPARTDPVEPAVFAAQCELDGLHVCAGRFNARNGGIPGGRPASSTDTDLIVYLAGLACLPQDEWKPFFQFFSPRRAHGAGLGNRLVWGEDCRAKQHFDGVGLVNWCLEQAIGAHHPITFDMATWATGASGTEPVTLTEPPRTGDILLRAIEGRLIHIGFLVNDHDLDVLAGHAGVVLAEQPSVGVVLRRFSPAGWNVRRRFSKTLLHD